MNVHRSGDLNQRKSILKPLSAGTKKRPEHHHPEAPDSSSTSIRNEAQSTDQSTSQTVKKALPSLTSRLPRLEGLRGEVFSRQVTAPVWLIVILALALVAGPIVAILYPSGSGDDAAQQAEVAIEPTETPAEVVEEEIPLALELDEMFDPRQWEPAPPPSVSSRQQYLLDQGVEPNREVRYGVAEVERLQAELEAIQRNSAMLRSLARQQSGDLSVAYSSLEATQENTDGALEDLQSRIDDLEERIKAVDDLARELRDLLGMPPSDAGVGGPVVNDEEEDVDPWLKLRNDVVSIEHWAGELVFELDEVNTEIQLRIARLEQAEAEARAQAEAEAQAQAQAEAQAQAQVQQSAPPKSSGSSISESLQYYDSSPMGWPVQGPITSRFGVRSSPFSGEGGSAEMHTGIDIAARTGTPVIATGGGTVQLARDNGGYGLLVVIDHGRGIATWYGHNSRLLVSPGQRVNAGDVIAEVGSTGRSTGPHVHYEVRVNGVPHDPLPYMQMIR